VTAVLRIGTRGSALALAQARSVQAALEGLQPRLRAELRTVKTTGDRFLDRPLALLGGKGLFVKELEEALLAGTVDLAVHSMKDVPAEVAPGLVLGAVLPREDPGDVLVARSRSTLADLPRGARVGTSSLRRSALLRARRPDLEVVPLRGNVDTRLGKLRSGVVDAVVLAAAGLKRLGLVLAEAVPLDPLEFLPAIGQGALGIETRADEVQRLVAPLDHAVTRAAVEAERAFLRRVGGTCHTPIAAHAIPEGRHLLLRAAVFSVDGSRLVQGERRGPMDGAAELGEQLAVELLRRGAEELLAALRGVAR